MGFKTFLAEAAQADFKTLWKYFEQIKKNPNPDDIKTLIKMIARLDPSRVDNYLSDMWSDLQEIVAKMPSETQEDIKRTFASIKHNDPVYKARLFKHGWHGGEPYQLRGGVRELEDILVGAMAKENPALEHLYSIVTANKHLWDALDDSFKQQYLQWFQEEIRKKQSQPTMQDAFRDMFKSVRKKPEDH